MEDLVLSRILPFWSEWTERRVERLLIIKLSIRGGLRITMRILIRIEITRIILSRYRRLMLGDMIIMRGIPMGSRAMIILLGLTVRINMARF